MPRGSSQQGRSQQAFEHLLDPEFLDEDLLRESGTGKKVSSSKAKKSRKREQKAGFRFRDEPSKQEGLKAENGDLQRLSDMFGGSVDSDLTKAIYGQNGGDVVATADALLEMGFAVLGIGTAAPDAAPASDVASASTSTDPLAAPMMTIAAAPSFWDALPPELQEDVWRRLDAQELARAARVCKRFAVYVRGLRANTTSLTTPTGLTPRTLSGFVVAFPAAKRLVLKPAFTRDLRDSFQWRVVSAALGEGNQMKLARGGAPLEFLGLQKASSLQDVDLVCLLENLHTLQHLDLTGCGRLTDESLQALSRYSAGFQTDLGLDSTLEGEPLTQQANAREDRKVARQKATIQENLELLGEKHQPRRPSDSAPTGFQSLKLEGCCFTRFGLQRLLWRGFTARSLKTLDVSGIEGISQKAVDFGPESGLQLLRAQRCMGMREFVTLLPPYQALQVVDMAGCRNLKTAVLTAPRLKKLNLSQCTSLAELSVLAPRLADLNLAQCSRLSRPDVRSRSLQRLNLNGCPSLTSAGLENLLHQSPRLEHLDLNGCVGIGRVDLEASAELSVLDVTGCRSLRQLTCSSPELKRLSAVRCSSLLEVQLLTMVLEHLDVQNCELLGSLQLPRMPLSSQLRYCVCNADAIHPSDLARLKQVGRALPGHARQCGC